MTTNSTFYIAWRSDDGTILYLAQSEAGGVIAVSDMADAAVFDDYAAGDRARREWTDALIGLDGAILTADEIAHQFDPDQPAPRPSFRDDPADARRETAALAAELAELRQQFDQVCEEAKASAALVVTKGGQLADVAQALIRVRRVIEELRGLDSALVASAEQTIADQIAREAEDAALAAMAST